MEATRSARLERADADLFSAARLRAARLQPYLASAVFSLIPVPRPGYGTFGVDRWWRVYVDMDTARAWGVEATAAVLIHEAHHVLRDHHGRAERLGLQLSAQHRWNIAGDLAINDDLREDGLELPDPVLPQQFGFGEGLIEEQYFRLLSSKHADRRESCGSGSGGSPIDGEIDEQPIESGADGVDEVDQRAIRRAVAHDVDRAIEQGEPVSPGLARWAQDTLRPQVRWQAMLRSALGRSVRWHTSRSRPDWTRADRRADSRPDFPRPGLRSHRPEVAVVIDTSSSMSKSLLDAAVSEINSLLHRAGLVELTVVVCDAVAVQPQRVRRLGDLVLPGGGGTDLRVGIEAATRCRPAPSIIVVLTDGLTPWPTCAPARTQLIAVVIGASAALPSGERITALRIRDQG